MNGRKEEEDGIKRSRTIRRNLLSAAFTHTNWEVSIESKPHDIDFSQDQAEKCRQEKEEEVKIYIQIIERENSHLPRSTIYRFHHPQCKQTTHHLVYYDNEYTSVRSADNCSEGVTHTHYR